jgi:hypothetical protein
VDYSIGSGKGPVASSCEHGNELIRALHCAVSYLVNVIIIRAISMFSCSETKYLRSGNAELLVNVFFSYSTQNKSHFDIEACNKVRNVG